MKRNLTLALIVCTLLGQSAFAFSPKEKSKGNLGKFKLEEIMAQDPDGNGKTKLQRPAGR